MRKLVKNILIFVLFVILACLITIWIYRNIAFPKRYKSIVEQACSLYNVDPNLIYSIIKQESNFNPRAVSNSGAKGLMQIMDKTADEVVKNIKSIDNNNYNIFDPTTNIYIGTKYFAYLTNYFEGNYYIAIVAYNAGLGNVEKWLEKPYNKYSNYLDLIEEIEYNETETYLLNILNYYDYYTKLYD